MLERLSTNVAFGGELTKFQFKSSALGGLIAKFNLYLPPASLKGTKVPVLVYLAGLTCTEDTGAQKGGFIREAAAENIAILFPDTSPREAGIEGEKDDWDFGEGAGFYLDATAPKFSDHYNMYSHITQELPKVIQDAGLAVDLKRQSVFGHSMGGHGALTLYLQSLTTGSEPAYRSASAFAPITNPVNAPWGQKAFKGYLQGGIEEARSRYDATELISKTKSVVKILIDCGTNDQFYKQNQLLPENFIEASRKGGHDESQVDVRLHAGYDHSYYFISTFAEKHVQFHAKVLNA